MIVGAHAAATGRSKRERAAAVHDLPVLRSVLRRLPSWRGLLIFNYHRIGDAAGQPWDRALWSTSAAGLDAQLTEITRHVDLVDPADVPEVVRSGRGRHAVLTFDDGYRDNYELALPVLQRHGARAAFFVTTGFLDEPRAPWWDEIAWMVRHATRDRVSAGPGLDAPVAITGPEDEAAIAHLVATYKRLPAEATGAYLDHLAEATGSGRCPASVAAGEWMTWDMARALRDAGMTVGGHTVTHPILSSLDQAGQEREIAGCAERLREELGESMRFFAYPVGARTSFDERTKAVLRRQGVEVAYSFYGGHQPFGDWDPFDARRVHVWPELTPQLLRAMLGLPQLFSRPS